MERLAVRDLEDLSNIMFGVLYNFVGTFEHVSIRRTKLQIHNTVCKCAKIHGFDVSKIVIGSSSEGFRFQQSDVDTMLAIENWRVTANFSQSNSNISNRPELLIINCATSPPGYCLLETSNCSTQSFLNSTKMIHGKEYLSSSAVNKKLCSSLPYFRVNGPCGRMNYRGCDTDAVVGCISDFWPPVAFAFRNRHSSWPSNKTLNDIVSSGCHFVPIGHKSSNNVEDEWRISFCIAEQKLVYSMSHFEFLLYGLLKLCLTDIINKNVPEEDKLLSSYHIKTSVFWVLQQSSLPKCCPWNLLQYFWFCFKLILKWVYQGVCPNFFIPENNMFLAKVYGSAQEKLFTKLLEIYEKGLPCLINTLLINSTIPKCEIAIKELFIELETFTLPILSFQHSFDYLRIIENLVTKPLPQIQNIMVQKLKASCINQIAYITSFFNKGLGSSGYMIDKMTCRLLSLSADIGSDSDILFSAMYYYKTCRYTQALFFLNKARETLTQPLNLEYEKQVDIELFQNSTKGMSLKEIVKTCFVFTIKLHNAIPYINELHLEQQSSKSFPYFRIFLQIPPIILLHMLEFLCYRHVRKERAKLVLDDLVTLVHNHSGKNRDILWEILGLCHQLSGNLQEALDAYRQSIKEHPDNNIRAASLSRIKDISDHMEQNSHNESV